MGNPHVRPNLHFWPEDSGGNVSEARQASRWMHEMPDDLAPPMIRSASAKDFYIFEPAVLQSHEKGFCMPYRWFRRNGTFWAKCWTVLPDRAQGGWWVDKGAQFEVPESELLLNLEDFALKHGQYKVPTPKRILGALFLFPGVFY